MKTGWLRYGACMIACSVFAVCSEPVQAQAAGYLQLCAPHVELETYTAYVSESADVYVSMDSYDILETAMAGEYFSIASVEGDGWMGVTVGDTVGYVSDEQVTICNPAEWELLQQDEEVQAQIKAAESMKFRKQVAAYALQFLGCPYVYGGSNPATGVDCSGFTRYVMKNAAGVTLEGGSVSQSTQGTAVSAEQMRPGDLIFYGKNGQINHVGIYIGDEQVVHASCVKTGVKISKWTYRTPLVILNVIGD